MLVTLSLSPENQSATQTQVVAIQLTLQRIRTKPANYRNPENRRIQPKINLLPVNRGISSPMYSVLRRLDSIIPKKSRLLVFKSSKMDRWKIFWFTGNKLVFAQASVFVIGCFRPYRFRSSTEVIIVIERLRHSHNPRVC